MNYRALFLTLIIFLTACQTTPPQGLNPNSNEHREQIEQNQAWNEHLKQLNKLDKFIWRGRFSSRDEQEQYSGQIIWEHQDIINEIIILAPFGQTVAQITSNENETVLISSEKDRITSDNLETLFAEAWPQAPDLNALYHWLKGEPNPELPYQAIRLNQNNNLLYLEQDGWTLRYGQYRNYHQQLTPLPGRIEASRDNFRLILVTRDWQWLNSD